MSVLVLWNVFIYEPFGVCNQSRNYKGKCIKTSLYNKETNQKSYPVLAFCEEKGLTPD